MPGRSVKAPVSAMIFTLNEEVNLPHCLKSLRWCDDIVVVDSFSTDRTGEIAERAGARVFRHAFEGFGKQRNWALDNTAPRHEWILILDADERVPPELVEELARTLPVAGAEVAAYRVARRFHMWGRWLRYSSLYPSYVVRLIRRGRVRYLNRGHAETQVVDGQVLQLTVDLIDENHKGVDDWYARQNAYSTKDAEYELAEERKPLRMVDLLSGDPLARRAALKRLAWRLPMRPVLYFLYSYLLRGGFRDGKDGLVFCQMRAAYQRMVVTKKHSLRRCAPTGAAGRTTGEAEPGGGKSS